MVKLADFVADYLANCETVAQDVFLVSGGGNMHLLNSIGKHPRLNYYCNHHEQACTMAAEGYARVTNKIGVSLVTTGPGGTNAITGIMGAWVDSIPTLTISGQVKLETTVLRAPDLRQLGDQEINIVDIVRPITKYAAIVTDKQDIRYHLEKAIYLAKCGRPGPVWLDIPLDIQAATVDETALRHFDPLEIVDESSSVNTMKQMVQLLELFAPKKRPVLVVGNGVRLAGAVDDLIPLVEKLGIPVLTTISGIDLISSDHPLFFGRPGVLGDRAANFIFQNSDLLIVVGTRLNLRILGFDFQSLARSAIKVMVDVDKAELFKPTFPVDVPIHCDAGVFIKLFSEAVDNLSDRADLTEWIGYCRRLKETYPVVLPEHRNRKDFISSYYFAERLSSFLKKDDIIVTGNGTAYTSMHQVFHIQPGQRMFANVGCAAMGYDLPAAIGACIASGRHRIICVTGDGSIQMNLQELQTIAHHQLPIKIFMLENDGYVSIKNTQETFFEACFIGSDCSCGVSLPDMKKLAAVYGLPVFLARDHSEIDAAIQNTLEIKGPAFCEIHGDPHEKLGPKTASRQKPDGTMKSCPLEDLAPFLPREEFMANMIIPPAEDDVN